MYSLSLCSSFHVTGPILQLAVIFLLLADIGQAAGEYWQNLYFMCCTRGLVDVVGTLTQLDLEVAIEEIYLRGFFP